MVMIVEPDCWNVVNDVWVLVRPLMDPLLRENSHRVTVHRDLETGLVSGVDVAGNNAGSRWLTVPPDTLDFEMTNGEPL